MHDTTSSGRRSFIPPYILERLASDADPTIAARAREAIAHDEQVRRHRRELPAPTSETPRPAETIALAPRRPHRVSPRRTAGVGEAPAPHRTISDAHGQRRTPGHEVRAEGEPPTGDAAADEAYDGLGATWRLWFEVFGRDSLDGKGLPLLATVHYGTGYDNAFWDGSQMVFGDGDGVVFQRFTRSLDVIGHELAHGVTASTAGLLYQGQSGALNESMSDVFGVLVRQYHLGQTAAEADWLIGADLLGPTIHGRGLRDMHHPGTAYDDPRLGTDPQPDHMDHYVETTDDNGGVHLNSGIPNRAFVLAALAIGGPAWEDAGHVWEAALVGDGIAADCDFATFARLTVTTAARLHGEEASHVSAVRSAWEQVGVLPPESGSPKQGGAPADVRASGTEVLLRRTGGFAGLVKERRVVLDDLPDPEARHWRHLLAAPTLERIAQDQTTHPDAYCYELHCDEPPVHVSVVEPHLPEAIHSLFERTLED